MLKLWRTRSLKPVIFFLLKHTPFSDESPRHRCLCDAVHVVGRGCSEVGHIDTNILQQLFKVLLITCLDSRGVFFFFFFLAEKSEGGKGREEGKISVTEWEEKWKVTKRLDEAIVAGGRNMGT